jgi:hypothetical protein
MFPGPNSTIPVTKQSFVEGFRDIARGVGYYNTADRQAPADLSRIEGAEKGWNAVIPGRGRYPRAWNPKTLP